MIEVRYTCDHCNRLRAVNVATGSAFPPGAPVGWYTVADMDGFPVSYVCSQECHKEVESWWRPIPDKGNDQ